MKVKSIEDKYSAEIDAYLNGIKETSRSKSQEYNELLDLGKTLVDTDFSIKSDENTVLTKVIKNINENKGDKFMKKSNTKKRTAVAAASLVTACVLSVSIIQPSFAKDLASKIIKTFKSGNVTVVQVEDNDKGEIIPISENLKGKVFDKNGKPIDMVTKGNKIDMYTEKGEKIIGIANGEIVTEDSYKESRKRNNIEVKDVSKLNEYTSFKVILPSYLPEGYKFDRAEAYKSSKDYIDLYFKNEKTGKIIYMQQRAANEDTKGVSGTSGKIEEVKINNVDGIISDNRNIDWQYNNVVYSMSAKGEVVGKDLIKIAESIK